MDTQCRKTKFTTCTYPEDSLKSVSLPPKSQSDEDRNMVLSRGDSNHSKSSYTSPVKEGSSLKEVNSSYRLLLKSSMHEDKPAKAMEKYGVRIRPAVVSFTNTFENQVYTETVSVQNISENPVSVRMDHPRAWSFRMTPMDRSYLLAPGLKISCHMQYTCTKNGIVQSKMPIYVNDNIIELPLEAYKEQAFVEITPLSIKFGRVDIGCKPVERKIFIKNVSFCATKFLVDIGPNELDFLVTPMKGWIRPNSSISIKLKLLALREGLHTAEIWITTNLCQTRINIEVEAYRPYFMVIHPNTISDFTLINFPLTFYGCRRYQTLEVYNMASSSSAFVVLAEIGHNCLQPLKEAQKGDEQSVKMFDVEPAEGRIKPFEGKNFTIWFKPTMTNASKKSENDSDIKDFLCAVKIKRIPYDDFGANYSSGLQIEPLKDDVMPFSEDNQSNSNIGEVNSEMLEAEELSTETLIKEISVLLYLYGEAEVPSLYAIPDTLYFQHTLVGETVVKVVQLTNNSSQSLAFRYSKIPFFEVLPVFKQIAPNAAFDVTIKFRARNIGSLNKNLTFEVLVQSNATDKLDFHVVSHVTVKISGEVISQKKVPEPKFNPGITPIITHEVGFLTDEVTFTSKIEKPRCAMTTLAQRGRPWHRPDATIAFPNDRPLTLRPRPTDATARTIYKGLTRYVAPVDETMTYTAEELIRKKAHDDQFLKFIRGTAALSVSKDFCCKWKIPSEIDLDSTVVQDKQLDLPREVLVPLTFVQLYRIKVYPPVISFGCVIKNKRCSQILSIENSNDFKICASLKPCTSVIQVQTLENFIIPDNSDAKVIITFQREVLGKYSGTITCIINGFHLFDIAVVAEVAHRSLTVTPDNLVMKVPEVPFASTFVPVAINSPLNIPITFSWVIPEKSPIRIEPVIGVIPERGTVWSVVYFEPETPNFKMHPIELAVEGTTCLKLITSVILPKTNVYFLDSNLNVGYIPMNLTTIRRIYFFNPDFSDAMFIVLNKEPVKGIKVKPASGTIRARSYHALLLQMTLTSQKSLDFTIYMTLQNSASIEIRITGTVVYPQINITPQYISFHRVPCNSVTRTTLQAENKSKAKAEVSFNMEEYPQFKVSLSKRVHDPGVTSEGFILDPETTKKFYLFFTPKDLASYDFYLPIVINNLYPQHNSSKNDMEIQYRMIRSINNRVSFDTRKASVSTRTAVTLMSHLVFIDVAVLKASLVISETEIFFSSTSELKSFTIKNTSEQATDIIVRCNNYEEPFNFEVDTGEEICNGTSYKVSVDPGELLRIISTFTATSPGIYTTDMSVMINVEDRSCVYTKVQLTGCIALPCIVTCSVSEAYFQPVPLNVDTSFLFHLKIIHNQQRESVINYEIISPNAELFTVDYPDGNKVAGITKTSISVKLTFRSSLPISLRKQITFKAGKSSECSITMVATADNCIATTYTYLKNNLAHEEILQDFEMAKRELSSFVNGIGTPRRNTINELFMKNSRSCSGGSETSIFSLHTISSVNKSSDYSRRTNSTVPQTGHFIAEEKEQKRHSESDLDMPFELNEENPPPSITDTTEFQEIITKEDEEMAFPMFPMKSSLSEETTYMSKTLISVQQWAYEQVFCCSYNPIFGSHTFSSFSFNKKNYSQSSPAVFKNVFDALEKICGRRIRRFFTPIDKIPEDPTAKAVFTYNLYQQLVDFMVAQGALMAHVEPKYLMVYDEYCSYYKSIRKHSTETIERELGIKESETDYLGSSELMSDEKFCSISIQCWLDLFLQIFKTLVLAPAVGINYGCHEASKQHSQLVHDDHVNKSVYGRAEEILMSWLTNQYNTQRTLLWPNKSPPQRVVSNFDKDLEDGLVLTATTAAYCQHLSEIHFGDMFMKATTISQAYHNATCLCIAWDSIKLGYSITPRDFIQRNTINMLLLVTHLYKVLPSYKPEATITFKSILNASDSQIITLENSEEASVTYHVEILPNNQNFFLENCENTLVLKHKSKIQITVQYLARNTNKTEAILLLCGACMPSKFGRNYVFKLEGYPFKLPVSSSFNIIAPQNTPLNTTITVESPHTLDFKANESYLYNLWVAYTEPQPENLNALCWAKERRHKLPRRLFFPENTLVVKPTQKKTGSGVLDLKVCCFSQLVKEVWLIFRNQEIGDFIVKLQITPRRPAPVMNLFAMMSTDSKCSCTSERLFNCSRLITVNVPCRNLEQWTAVMKMFELTISPAEKEFWATYMESNVGLRLLVWMLEEKKEKLGQELELLFKKNKVYKVSCPSKYISCTPTLEIPDVRSESSLPVQLHLDENIPSLSTVLNLISVDGKEKRSYNLNIAINK